MKTMDLDYTAFLINIGGGVILISLPIIFINISSGYIVGLLVAIPIAVLFFLFAYLLKEIARQARQIERLQELVKETGLS